MELGSHVDLMLLLRIRVNSLILPIYWSSYHSAYYRFDVEIHAEFSSRVAVSVRESLGCVVRDRDLVVK